MGTIELPWWQSTVVGLIFLGMGYLAHAVFNRIRVTAARSPGERSASVVVRTSAVMVRYASARG